MSSDTFSNLYLIIYTGYLLNVVSILEEVGHRHPDMPEEETVACNIRCAGAVIKSLPASDVWMK